VSGDGLFELDRGWMLSVRRVMVPRRVEICGVLVLKSSSQRVLLGVGCMDVVLFRLPSAVAEHPKHNLPNPKVFSVDCSMVGARGMAVARVLHGACCRRASRGAGSGTSLQARAAGPPRAALGLSSLLVPF